MSFKCSFTSHKLGNNYCIINIMALIAIIIFSLTALIGRVVFHYKLTGTSGIKFERKSLSSTSFSIYSVLVGVGFYGIVILSILEVLDKFNAQFNLGINGIILGWAIVFIEQILRDSRKSSHGIARARTLMLKYYQRVVQTFL